MRFHSFVRLRLCRRISCLLVPVLALTALGTTGICGEIQEGSASADVAKLKVILAENPSLIAKKDKDGLTLLHRAAMAGQKEVAELLIANKADLNARDNQGWTPLHRAASEKQKEIAELLLANHAEAEARDDSGQSPLHEAAWYDAASVAEVLLAYRAEVDGRNDLGRTPLITAASRNSVEVSRVLLAHGADAKATAKDGVTALHLAAYYSSVECVNLLLAHGSDVNAIETHGMMPLHAAAASGRQEIVDFLLAHGARADAKDSQGRTPMMVADEYKKTDVAEFLRRYSAEHTAPANSQSPGARIRQYQVSPPSRGESEVEAMRDPTKWGRAGRIAGKGYQHVSGSVAEMFYNGDTCALTDDTVPGLTYTLNGCGRFKTGETVYYRVSNSPSTSNIGIPIFRKTVSVREMNKAELHPVIMCEALTWTDPMGEAVHAGNLEAVKSLLKVEPQLVSSTDAFGFTPLHWTAIKGWKEIAELLLAEHAEVNARDRNDNTPLHYSITGSHAEVAALLRVHGGIE